MISATLSVVLKVVLFGCCLAWPLVSGVNSVVWNPEKDYMPDCEGKCSGRWASWTSWAECKGGECHLNMGRQSRQRDCYRWHKPSASRGDNREKLPEGEWRTSCRQKGEKACVEEKTCKGKWASWRAWTECVSARNGTCRKTRRRLCLASSNERISGSHCMGGFPSDTDTKTCANRSCKIQQPRMSLTRKTNDSLPSRDKEARIAVESLKSKSKGKGLSHNTVLIIAVSVGSLMFTVVFVLLLVNFVRSKSRNSGERNRRDSTWKRIGSTYTSSTACSNAAASDFMSTRTEFIDIRSPSAMTVASGSTSSGSQPHFFGRNDNLTHEHPVAGESTHSAMLVLPASERDCERPRRSRLLQENVYWEITDATAEIDAEDDEHETNVNLEVVQNVLYGDTA